ncbi:hypothetical protein [Dongshaea marina]|uniref:hypothetical protein n=1 Tax=Dongshaea marina TaxID=2047966 RepID=UPI000D3E21D8|nr:hypothetical protein [Dongshaea marina]
MKRIILFLIAIFIFSTAHADKYTIYCKSFSDSHHGQCQFNDGNPDNSINLITLYVKMICNGDVTTSPKAHQWWVDPAVGSTQVSVGGPNDPSGDGGCGKAGINNIHFELWQNDGKVMKTSKVYVPGNPEYVYGSHAYISNWSEPKKRSCWHIDGNTGCAKVDSYWK